MVYLPPQKIGVPKRTFKGAGGFSYDVRDNRRSDRSTSWTSPSLRAGKLNRQCQRRTGDRMRPVHSQIVGSAWPLREFGEDPVVAGDTPPSFLKLTSAAYGLSRSC